MFNNWGYDDPADLPAAYEPFEADDYILYLIESGKAPVMEGV